MDLRELSQSTGVSPRTVHFYVQQGLLPPPTGAGRAARYGAVHRNRLRLIRQLQAQHLPLVEIRRQLEQLSDADLQQLSSGPRTAPSDAATYIRSVLHQASGQPTPPRAALPLSMPSAPASSPHPARREVDRSQWERLVVDPDVEIHLRRPTSRATNRKIERLVQFARTLFTEEP